VKYGREPIPFMQVINALAALRVAAQPQHLIAMIALKLIFVRVLPLAAYWVNAVNKIIKY